MLLFSVGDGSRDLGFCAGVVSGHQEEAGGMGQGA